MIHVDTRF